MQSYWGPIDQVPINTEPSVIAIGYFDGFHRAHQELLEAAQKIATEQKLKLIVMSFYGQIKDTIKSKLMNRDLKLQFIANNYPESYAIFLEMTQDLREMTPQIFIHWLKKHLNVVKVVEGADFHFGYHAKGNIKTLEKAFGEENVVAIQRDSLISSSLIREELAKGNFENAIIHLGHPLAIEVTWNKKTNSYNWLAPDLKLHDGHYHGLTDDGQIIKLNLFKKELIIKPISSKYRYLFLNKILPN